MLSCSGYGSRTQCQRDDCVTLQFAQCTYVEPSRCVHIPDSQLDGEGACVAKDLAADADVDGEGDSDWEEQIVLGGVQRVRQSSLLEMVQLAGKISRNWNFSRIHPNAQPRQD